MRQNQANLRDQNITLSRVTLIIARVETRMLFLFASAFDFLFHDPKNIASEKKTSLACKIIKFMFLVTFILF